jgi:TRAP-type C4-dicarboxylate transport system permease small subunit
LLVGASLILLRRQPTEAPRRFACRLYPLTPLLFIASSLLMLYATFEYAIKNGSAEAGWAIASLVIGYLLSLAEEKIADAR